MEIGTQELILRNTVKSMIVELSERIGDENPWLTTDVDVLKLQDLTAMRRALHELLYVPPTRH